MLPSKYDGKEYCPLHVHSGYSIRDGISSVKSLVDRAVELNIPGIALTDHGTMAGSIHLYNYAKEKGIKPILGVEVYIANRSRYKKEAGIDKYYHLTLLAMNINGWKNLSTLIGLSHEADAKYNKPRIDRELLRRYSDDIICLSGCYGGNLSFQIRADMLIEDSKMYVNAWDRIDELEQEHGEDYSNEYNFAKETPQDVIDWHKGVFGDRFYIEIQNHNMGETEQTVISELFRLAEVNNIKYVITTDSHFTNVEDREVHNIMLASGRGITINDEKWSSIPYHGDGYHIMNYSEIMQLFPGKEQGLINTLEIMDRCNVEFEFGNYRLPSTVEDPSEENDVFMRAVEAGLEKRFGEDITPEIIERTQLEVDTIIQMALPAYFLVVAEYTQWAKDNEIPVGPGRGSAGGSMVAYLLNITEVDPLVHKLFFGRFLNKGRAAIPVIDFDELTYDKFRENDD